MTAAAAADVTANVLFLRLRGPDAASRASAPEGHDVLARKLAAALPGWPPAQRVVLQAADGLAVVGEVDGAVLLDAARRLCAQGPAAFGIALHRGPLRVLPEAAGGPRLAGAVLHEAAALALAAGAQPLMTEAFRARLLAGSPLHARDLRAVQAAPGVVGPVHAWDAAGAGSRERRRAVLQALGIGGLLAAGWAARIARESYEAARRPGVLVLDIRPSGEVFVDGTSRGTAPPLARLSLPPGPHTIEVRHGRAKPMRLEVQLAPGQELEVSHVFTAPPARRATPRPKPGPFERFKFW